jgi:hypothetical protein
MTELVVEKLFFLNTLNIPEVKSLKTLKEFTSFVDVVISMLDIK